MTRITIDLPDSLRESLDRISRREQRALEDVVQDLVGKAVALDEVRRLRQELKPYAESAGFHTDEDVFREIS